MSASRERIRGSLKPLLPLLFFAPILVAGTPRRAASGQTLSVPEVHLEMGAVHHLWPGDDTQLLLISDAPLQRVAVRMSRMIGYVVTPLDLDPERDETPILAGAFRIPVASFDTGTQSGREVLRSPEFLAADRNPEIEVGIRGLRDVEYLGNREELSSYRVTIQADVRVRGKQHRLSFPALVSLSPFNERTMARNVGDIVILKGSVVLDLEMLGWRPPNPPHKEGAWVYFSLKGRVASKVSLDYYLMFNNVRPDRGPDLNLSWQRRVGLNPDENLNLRDKLSMFVTLLRDLNQPDRGYALGAGLMKELRNDPHGLNDLASRILNTEGIERRDYAFALRAARRAWDLSREKNPLYSESLALISLASGHPEQALNWARKTLELVDVGDSTLSKRVKSLVSRTEREVALIQGLP